MSKCLGLAERNERVFQEHFLLISRQVAEEEVDHLFVSSDTDHDDRLAYQEIIDNYDTFVGSEATDYGDHLQNIDHFRDEL